MNIKTDPALKAPKTEFEKTVSHFNLMLEEERKKEGDENWYWLQVADGEDISQIQNRWDMPEKYLTFLKRFSPVNVFLRREDFMNELALYGADELIERQSGYSYNPMTNKKLEEWPDNLVVIADDGADPYCINLDEIENGDAPIYRSEHGMGHWEFELYADSFQEFLQMITEMEHVEE